MNHLFPKLILPCVLILIVILVINACTHTNDIELDLKESSANKESHYAGLDCMSCHHDSKNEASEKWWYVAGTAYNTDGKINTNGSIELWSGKNSTGTLLKRIYVDKSGNFYTNKIINFVGGCYPVAVSATGNRTAMQSIFNGQGCNSCHGIYPIPRIVIN